MNLKFKVGFLTFLVTFASVSSVSGQAITEKTFQYITRINKMMEEEAFDEALEYAERVESFALKDYDRAVVLNTKGNIYMNLERYLEGAETYKEAIGFELLADEIQQQLKLSVGQILISKERFAEGVKYLEWWLEKEEEPKPEVLIALASGLTQMREYDRALVYVERAVVTSDEPKKSWYDLWIAIHFQKKDYLACTEVLSLALINYPQEKKYWSQLSGLFLQLEDDSSSLAVMRLAYDQGMINDQKDLLQLVKLFYFLDIPYNGASIMEKGLSEGKIAPTEEHYKLLAEGWLRSKEYDRALVAFSKASDFSSTGEYDLYRAQIFIENEDWEEAASALELASKKGGLPNEGTAAMMLVMSYFEQNKFEEALTAVENAIEIPSVSERAKEWKSYLEEELQAFLYRQSAREELSG